MAPTPNLSWSDFLHFWYVPIWFVTTMATAAPTDMSSLSSNEPWSTQVDVEVPDDPNVVQAPAISYARCTKKNLSPDQDV